MVDPFVAESSVLFALIEIMETTVRKKKLHSLTALIE